MIEIHPPLTPIVNHNITRKEGTVDRFTLEYGQRSQVIFGHVFHDDDDTGILTVKVVGAEGTMYLNRRNIVAQQAGYYIYEQRAIHRNTNFLEKGEEEGVRETIGARHKDKEPLKASKGTDRYSGTMDFEKACEIIRPPVKIG